MVYYVDIDNTICYYPEGATKQHPGIDEPIPDYDKALPYLERIGKINKLFNSNHIVVYWTARGTVTGLDLYDKTLEQLQQWGCEFTELKLGKPYYDLFIDDRNINSETFFS
jgi:hypothetical protein